MLEESGTDSSWIMKYLFEEEKEEKSERRLDQIYRDTLSLIRRHSPDVLAIERLFFYRNQNGGTSRCQRHFLTKPLRNLSGR